MKITFSPNEIRIRDNNAPTVILGGFFSLLGGLIVVGTLFFPAPELQGGKRLIALCAGLLPLMLGVTSLIFRRRTETVIRPGTSVTLAEIRGTKIEERNIYWPDIQSFDIENHIDDDGDHQFYLRAHLRKGTFVRLHTVGQVVRSDLDLTLEKLQAFC